MSEDKEPTDETEDDTQSCPNDIVSNLDGPYWNNGTIATNTDLYMLSAITTYSNIDGLHGLQSTP